jgi:hypothetical protein
MERIVDLLIGMLDWRLIVVSIVSTYLLIKLADKFNGRRPVPFWAKVTVTFICMMSTGMLFVCRFGVEEPTALVSVISAPLIWEWFLKKQVSKWRKAAYKKGGTE